MDKGDYKRPMQYEYYLVESIPDLSIDKQREIIEEALKDKDLKIKRQARIFQIRGCLSDSRHLGEKDTTLIVARAAFIGRNMQEIAYVIGMCRDKRNCMVVGLDCMELGTTNVENNLKLLVTKEIEEEHNEKIRKLKELHEMELFKYQQEIKKLKKKLKKAGLTVDNMHNLHKKKDKLEVNDSAE